MQKRILEELKKAYRPEFLNRIDETIVFRSLEKDEIHEIVKIMSRSIIKRLAAQEIQLKITPAALDVIGKAGFDPEYGARPIRRALQKEVEDHRRQYQLEQRAPTQLEAAKQKAHAHQPAREGEAGESGDDARDVRRRRGLGEAGQGLILDFRDARAPALERPHAAGAVGVV